MLRFRPLAAGALIACCLASPTVSAYQRFCASEDSLRFGNRAIGSSTTATVTIYSCGDEFWTFTDVRLHGATGSAFRVASACATGMTLGPGESCEVNVTFAPVLPGQTSGALWLRQTSTTRDQLLTFYGRGIATSVAGTAAIAFTPAVADFGTVALGTASPWHSIALTNVGNAPLVPSALVINGSHPYDFGTISHGDPADCAAGRAVAAGASCTLNFTFAPAAAGARSGRLVVDAPELASLVTLSLRGTGVDAKDGTIAAIEFFHAARNHYFLTTEPDEAAMIDAGGVGPGWVRTGMSFRVWPMTASVEPDTVDVCRFFGASGAGPDAHFFTGDARECATLRSDPVWRFEGRAFRAHAPVAGRCAPGFDAVVRLYWSGSAGTEMRHRYVVDSAAIQAMAKAGWIVEGAVFCSPR